MKLIVLDILPNNEGPIELYVPALRFVSYECILGTHSSLFDECIECLFNNHLMIRKIEYI